MTRRSIEGGGSQTPPLGPLGMIQALTDRQPTARQVNRIELLQKTLGLRPDDAIWSILAPLDVYLDSYDQLFNCYKNLLSKQKGRILIVAAILTCLSSVISCYFGVYIGYNIANGKYVMSTKDKILNNSNIITVENKKMEIVKAISNLDETTVVALASVTDLSNLLTAVSRLEEQNQKYLIDKYASIQYNK